MRASAPGATKPGWGSFAAEPYVIESYATVDAVKLDGTGTEEQTTTVKVQSEAALQQFGVLAISFERLSQTAEFGYARVHHPDGSVVETEVAGAMEQPAAVTREAPSYSDLYARELPIKDLRIGDVLEWRTVVTTTKPDIPGQVFGQRWFLSGAVVLRETRELRYPAAMPVKVWTNPAVAGRAALPGVGDARRSGAVVAVVTRRDRRRSRQHRVPGGDCGNLRACRRRTRDHTAAIDLSGCGDGLD